MVNQKICKLTGNKTPTNSGKNTGLLTPKTTLNFSQVSATSFNTSISGEMSPGLQGSTTGSWKSYITSPGVVTSVRLSVKSYTSEAITESSTTIIIPVTVSNDLCCHISQVVSEAKANTTVF